MFGGFKATLDLLGGKRKKNEVSELSSDLYVTGAYRTNREDVYGFSALDPPKSKPNNQIPPSLRPTKSTSNLVQPVSNLAQPPTADPNLRKSTPAISTDPRGAEQGERNSTLSIKDIKLKEKQQKQLEKKRQAEQKKQAQAQAKQEKLIRERAKKEAQIAAKAAKQKKPTGKPTTTSTTSPLPPPMPQPQTQPITQQAQPKTQSQAQPKTQPQAQPKTQAAPKTTPRAQPNPVNQNYSTNTLESSISRSSGPPPYSETPSKSKDNITLSKPVDNGSWDIITQHREQINRPAASSNIDSKRKQVVMDLNYKFGSTSDDKNSEV